MEFVAAFICELLATNSTKTITAIWMSLVLKYNLSRSLRTRCLTPTSNYTQGYRQSCRQWSYLIGFAIIPGLTNKVHFCLCDRANLLIVEMREGLLDGLS